ncbi:MAG: lipoprotein [Microbacterium sp.]|jgi:hypothetical protein|nr:lipoprotein [Microbacterium sp.]
MKRLPAVLAVAVAVALLSGCTSEVTQENITVTPGQSGTFSNGDTTIVVEPGATQGADGAYLTEVRANLGALASASDEQLVAAGESACGQLDEGVGVDQVVVTVPGTATVSSADSTSIAEAANAFLCG